MEEELIIRITPSGLQLIEENEIKLSISASWVRDKANIITDFIREWIISTMDSISL